MKLLPIIVDPRDTDMYTFSMGQAVFHQFPDLHVKFKFKCRNKGIIFTKEMLKEIVEQAEYFASLMFSGNRLDYFRRNSFYKSSYIDFLRLFHPLMDHCKFELTDSGELIIEITGPWYQVIYWEEPLLAIINEVYFKFHYTDEQYKEIMDYAEFLLEKKIDLLHHNVFDIGNVTDFGTRRRASANHQKHVINRFVNSDLGKSKFVGTSNVYFAEMYGLKAVGTNAHQWYQAAQGIKTVPLSHTNAFMMDAWIREYRGDLGMALTDCLGTDHFLKDFDLYHSKLWDGVRNDSGDPFAWGDKFIKHYESMKIDPKSKTLLFSNSLDFELADKLKKYFENRIKVGFGIGTYLTGVQKFESSWGEKIEPLNIVIKMIECEGRPVAKLSDDVGKGMCENPEYIKYLNETITCWS